MSKKTLVDILKERIREKEKYYKRPIFYAKKIKKIAQKLLKDKNLRVILFGSIIGNEWNFSSDIDVLIISDKFSKNWEENIWFKIKIKSFFKDAPFQIHLAQPEFFDNWYKKFIKENFIEI